MEIIMVHLETQSVIAIGVTMQTIMVHLETQSLQ